MSSRGIGRPVAGNLSLCLWRLLRVISLSNWNGWFRRPVVRVMLFLVSVRWTIAE